MNTAAFNPDHAPNTPSETPTWRRFPSEYKLRILDEYDRCTKPGDRGLILRREGLYSSHVANWRRWRRRTYPDHPESKKPPTASQQKHETARLMRENARLQLKLEHAEKMLGLQKNWRT